jgi:DNA-binding NtrC family response regulator
VGVEQSSKPYICVIDDETEILGLYEAMLASVGEIKSFSDPTSFIAEFDQPNVRVPDLIVTDLKMPQMTGLQMVQAIFKKGFHFPVILLSGHLDKDAVVEAVDIGVFKLLEKPTRFDVLMSTIEQILIEHDIYLIRKEVRHTVRKLEELYSTIRIAMVQHLPQDVLDRMFVETDDQGNVVSKVNFEDLIGNLESQLDELLNSERTLEGIRDKKKYGGSKK